MASVSIIDVRKVPATEPGRVGQLDTLVTYKTEAGLFFIASVKKESPTDQEVTEAIRKDQETRSRLVGKTLAL